MCVLDCNTVDTCSSHSHIGVTRQNLSLAEASAQNSSRRTFSGMVQNFLRKDISVLGPFGDTYADPQLFHSFIHSFIPEMLTQTCLLKHKSK